MNGKFANSPEPWLSLIGHELYGARFAQRSSLGHTILSRGIRPASARIFYAPKASQHIDAYPPLAHEILFDLPNNWNVYNGVAPANAHAPS